MAGAGGVFGEGSTARQLLVWGVLNQLIATAAAPAFNEVGRAVNTAFPTLPMDVGAAVEAAARHVRPLDGGRGQAQESGVPGDNFNIMVDNALHGPDLSMVMELLRRKLIEPGGDDPHSTTVGGALTDAGLRPEWHDLVTKLAVGIPDQSQVLTAWLTGQITEGEAVKRLTEAGMEPDWIQTAYNTEGQAPTPVQALELLNRGIIPEHGTGQGVVSYEQAFLEGPWRNKWLPSFRALGRYIPPPRTVTAMYHEGALTQKQAAHYLMDNGITAELAAAYLTASHHAAVAADKHLAKGEVVQLYLDHLMTKAQAHAALVALKYQPHDADLLLELADTKRTTAQLNAVVTRTRALYVAGKVTRDDAIATLTKVKVDRAEAGRLVDYWALEHAKVVKQLTPAQIVHAEFIKALTTAECDRELAVHGYSPFDAWVLRSLQHKTPQPNRPPLPGGGI
jgi:hypothetical protein